MTEVKVAPIVGPYCGTPEEGARLYQVITKQLKEPQGLTLDFSDVEIASSSFFAELISHLRERYGEEFLQSMVTFEGLQPRLRFVLDHTLTAIHA